MISVDEFKFYPFYVSHLAPQIKRIVEAELDVAIKRRDNFWTIGMSTYKDGLDDLDKLKVAHNNARMRVLFGDLYDFMAQFFSDMHSQPVQYMPDLPLPGFHVFKYCKDFEQPLARPHVDVPFNKYDWVNEVKGIDDIFTPVVPVEVPEGAGFRVWDLTASDMHKQGAEAIVLKARTAKPQGFVSHIPNRMCVHSGTVVHQIKPFDGPTDKWRITLQGHAVLLNGVWNLYW